MSSDRDELVAIIAQEATYSGRFIGTCLSDDIARAIIAAGFKRAAL